jgi:hypothetical protein
VDYYKAMAASAARLSEGNRANDVTSLMTACQLEDEESVRQLLSPPQDIDTDTDTDETDMAVVERHRLETVRTCTVLMDLCFFFW